jgi:hypothetical protein
MNLEQITKQWQAVHRGAVIAIDLAKKQGSSAQVEQFRRIAETAALKTDVFVNAVFERSFTSPDFGNPTMKALYEAGLNASIEVMKEAAPKKKTEKFDHRIEKLRAKTRTDYKVGDIVTAHWRQAKSAVFGVKAISLMDGASFKEPTKVRILFINDAANAVRVEVI